MPRQASPPPPTPAFDSGARAEASVLPPKRAEGLQLIGEYEESGFRQPPSIVRRADGQVIQLPDLFFRILSRIDGRASYEDISREVSADLGRSLSPEDVAYVVGEKLRPMGIVTLPDGSSPQLQRADPFLGLKFKLAVIPEQTSERLGNTFKWLFYWPVVAGVLAALVATDVWLFGIHGIAQPLRQALYHPAYFLPLLGAVTLGAAFHETGHAAACRFGGGHPGKMGCGLYLAWPAFYTDVTDAYRLGRRARLRTDLGGVYFNTVVILVAMTIYLATGNEAVLLLVVIEHFEIAHQLLPVVRLDGYYIIADITGVPDLFSRMRPILRSLIPGQPPDPKVTALKLWVRAAVTAWILLVVPLGMFEIAALIVQLPRIVATAWASALHLAHNTSLAFAHGQVLQGLSSAAQILVLALPIAGIVLLLARMATASSRWLKRVAGDRPVARYAILASSGAFLGVIALGWLPPSHYRPIQPGERGTIVQGSAALPSVVTGSYSPPTEPVVRQAPYPTSAAINSLPASPATAGNVSPSASPHKAGSTSTATSRVPSSTAPSRPTTSTNPTTSTTTQSSTSSSSTSSSSTTTAPSTTTTSAPPSGTGTTTSTSTTTTTSPA